MFSGWTAIPATLGIIINAVENQSDFIGGPLIAGLIGLSWTVTSFLVFPVLVIERKGPLNRSRSRPGMLKKMVGMSR
ncbi:DUF6159 family protein [Rhodohalobacter sp.]|uniref:DUF6159 family protein n=1 Tax=Rhodohalobacter sp. TaxID=1974210 RepID=UPI003A0FDB7A